MLDFLYRQHLHQITLLVPAPASCCTPRAQLFSQFSVSSSFTHTPTRPLTVRRATHTHTHSSTVSSRCTGSAVLNKGIPVSELKTHGMRQFNYNHWYVFNKTFGEQSLWRSFRDRLFEAHHFSILDIVRYIVHDYKGTVHRLNLTLNILVLEHQADLPSSTNWGTFARKDICDSHWLISFPLLGKKNCL